MEWYLGGHLAPCSACSSNRTHWVELRFSSIFRFGVVKIQYSLLGRSTYNQPDLEKIWRTNSRCKPSLNMAGSYRLWITMRESGNRPKGHAGKTTHMAEIEIIDFDIEERFGSIFRFDWRAIRIVWIARAWSAFWTLVWFLFKEYIDRRRPRSNGMFGR